MNNVTIEKSSLPAATRMARSRARRRSHLRCVMIEVSDREIAAFVRGGHLPLDKRDDPKAIALALESEVLPWYENRRRELEVRPLIRARAFGESVDPHRLDRLARYEVHLDRKLERMLAMLLKLQEVRADADAR
jgi:hypothetical protein